MPAPRRASSLLLRPLSWLLGLSGLCLLSAAPARAGDGRCAIYGPDFVAVEGTSTCIRIGGRVRVEAGTHVSPSLNSGWGNDGMRPAGVRSDSGAGSGGAPDGPYVSHLRLPDSLATSDAFLR